MPFNLSNLLHTKTQDEKEEQLETEAKKLEDQAEHAEIVANLQKRIASARKRIASTKIKSGSSGGDISGIIGIIQQNKLILGLIVVIGILFLIAKACSK